MRRCGSPAIVEKPFAKFEELSYVGAGIRAPVKSLKTMEQVLQAREHSAKLTQVYNQRAASRARLAFARLGCSDSHSSSLDVARYLPWMSGETAKITISNDHSEAVVCV